MTRASAYARRITEWADVLQRHGYELADPVFGGFGPLDVVIEARRSEAFGHPPVRLTIHELWVEGPDPEGLVPTVDGCHLQTGSWNASFGIGAEEQLRIDVDRTHSDCPIHLHPIDEPNDVRVPVSDLPAPAGWLQRVEEITVERIERSLETTPAQPN